MPESSTAAQRAPASPYYRWEAPGKPVSVLLSEQASDSVLLEGMRGLGLVPRRGAEVGGILLGRVQLGSPAVVFVEQAVRFECEYASGPVWVLSERDREAFRLALAAHREDGLRPVGFYRTDTRERIGFTAADLELFREFFPAPESVALIVKPRMMQSSVAGFFIWEDGFVSPASALEFLVQLRQAPARRGQEAPASPERKPEEPRGEVALPGFLAEQSGEEGGRQRLWRRWRILGPALAAMLAVAGYLGYSASQHRFIQRSPETVKQRDPYALSLVVLEYGDNLHLSWDREAPAVTRSKRGALTIADGDRSRTLELSPAQLRDGSVIYRRLTPEVRLKLEVWVDSKKSVAETWEAATRRRDSETKIGP